MRCYGRKEDRLRSLKRCLLEQKKRRGETAGRQQSRNKGQGVVPAIRVELVMEYLSFGLIYKRD